MSKEVNKQAITDEELSELYEAITDELLYNPNEEENVVAFIKHLRIILFKKELRDWVMNEKK